MSEWKNKLCFGDNLDILREHVPSESVDLIYLDPPFNSNATYNVLFQEKSGERSAAQITAFEDTWHWGAESEYAYNEVVTQGPRKLGDLLQAMRAFLGQNDMMAYLVMMAQRMTELHRVLKRTGSIYLHCDPTASHYLKLLMDAIFELQHFQNEIIWLRTTGHSDSHRWNHSHDVILFYTRTKDYTFSPQYLAYSDEHIASSFKYVEEGTGRHFSAGDLMAAGLRSGESGKPWRGIDPAKRHGHWQYTIAKLDELDREGRVYWPVRGQVPRLKRYLDEMPGRAAKSIWDDIAPVMGRQKLGYPTQKPEALLERIVKASSNEGDLVLDPFCGCGTTIAVAERLKRRWIGTDITHLAISLMRHRLHDTFGPELSPYEVIGDPKDLESARALAEQNRYQFEWWALGLVDARPAQDKRKGADSGVDGYINFFDDNSGKAKTIVVQVKSGHVNRSHIATLKGDMDREKAPIGIFVTLEEATRPMLEEAVAAGYYQPEHFPDYSYPRIQILTIKELLKGAQAQYPRMAPPPTFKRAQRRRKGAEDQQRLV